MLQYNCECVNDKLCALCWAIGVDYSIPVLQQPTTQRPTYRNCKTTNHPQHALRPHNIPNSRSHPINLQHISLQSPTLYENNRVSSKYSTA